MKKQQGFTLIELLISITLSLLLLAALVNIMLQNKRNYYLNNGYSTIQDNGRFLQYYMANYARLAGYRSPPAALSSLQFPDFETTFPTAAPYVGGESGTGLNGSDSVTFRFQGSGNGTGTPDGQIVDCLNQAIDAGTVGFVTFSVNNNAQLVCTAATGNQVVMDNVEKMNVLVGQDTDGDGDANRFVPFNHPGLDNSQIVSVRLSFLLRTDDNINPNPISKTYSVLNSTYTPAADKRFRRVYEFTFVLRNLGLTV